MNYMEYNESTTNRLGIVFSLLSLCVSRNTHKNKFCELRGTPKGRTIRSQFCLTIIEKCDKILL